MRYLLLVMTALAVLGCGGRDGARMGSATVQDFIELRRYQLQTGDADPQPVWAPEGGWILCRSQRSLLLLREGGKRVHRLSGGRRAGHPAWLNDHQVIFGPDEWVNVAEDGQVSVPSEGLRIVDVSARGFDDARDFGVGGWRPRPWQGKVVVQRMADLFVYDRYGNGELFDEGYFPEPRRDAGDITMQSTPMIAEDHWTGSDTIGNLVIRWEDAPVQIVPGCVEARWTSDGGIVATRLRGLAPDPARWWSQGTDVVWIAGPGAEPQLVMADARHPSPHPDQPVVAVMNDQGVVYLCARAGGFQREMVLDAGAPYWSPDGRQLAVSKRDASSGLIDLEVLVFKVRGQDGD